MSWSYRPELDGLRCLAVYLVLVFHTHLGQLAGGFIGVDIFFVLSGFLVTNVLLSEVDRTSTFRLGRFYARRVRRLLPAAVVVVVATSLVWLLVASQPQRLEMVRDAQAALLYLANWHFIVEANDYFAADTESSPFLHFWSLSIEEQFYVFYPLLLLLLLRKRPDRERWVLGLVLLLTAASVALQVYWAQRDETRAYFGTDAKLYQILAGAALALILRSLARRHGRHLALERGRLFRATWSVFAALGVGGLVLLGTDLVPLDTSARGLAAVGTTVLTITALSFAPRSWAARLLARPTPVYLGKISYGTYLWHWPVILVLGLLFDIPAEVLAILAALIATAFAALSFQVLETPLRTGRVLARFSWPVVISGVSTSLVAALLVVPPVLQADTRPSVAVASEDGSAQLTASATDTVLDQPVPADLDYGDIALRRGPEDQWCDAADVDRCLLADGSPAGQQDPLTIVLVGDSHARMIAPALAELAQEHGFRLYGSIVSSCPWMKGVYPGRSSKSNEEQCRAARDGFYDATLPAMEPDLVLLSSLHRSGREWEGGLVDTVGRRLPLHRLQAEGVDATVAAIEDIGAKAVIFKSIMGTNGWEIDGPDPLDCLARAETLRDCVVLAPRGQPIVDGFFDRAATLEDSVATVDVNAMVCPNPPVCPPILEGAVVWRNHDHLTSDVVEAVRGKIWAALEDAGAVGS